MIIESLRLFYHIPCFKCCVCGIQLGNGSAGADVRVRNHKLHCHNCYSNDEGLYAKLLVFISLLDMHISCSINYSYYFVLINMIIIGNYQY